MSEAADLDGSGEDDGRYLVDRHGRLLPPGSSVPPGTEYVTVNDEGRSWLLGVGPGDVEAANSAHLGPGRHQVLLVNSGAAHLVSTEGPVLRVQVLPDDATDVVALPEAGLLLVLGGTSAVAIDDSGVRWSSSGVVLGGLRLESSTPDAVVLHGQVDCSSFGDVLLRLDTGAVERRSTHRETSRRSGPLRRLLRR